MATSDAKAAWTIRSESGGGGTSFNRLVVINPDKQCLKGQTVIADIETTFGSFGRSPGTGVTSELSGNYLVTAQLSGAVGEINITSIETGKRSPLAEYAAKGNPALSVTADRVFWGPLCQVG